jgi:hypothetical protein
MVAHKIFSYFPDFNFVVFGINDPTDVGPSIARAHKPSLSSVAAFHVRIAPNHEQNADTAEFCVAPKAGALSIKLREHLLAPGSPRSSAHSHVWALAEHFGHAAPVQAIGTQPKVCFMMCTVLAS